MPKKLHAAVARMRLGSQNQKKHMLAQVFNARTAFRVAGARISARCKLAEKTMRCTLFQIVGRPARFEDCLKIVMAEAVVGAMNTNVKRF